MGMPPDIEGLRAELAALKQEAERLNQKIDGLSRRLEPTPTSPVPVAVPVVRETFAVPPAKAAVPARRADLESFIGGTLINRLGVLALFVGVGFFLKYAYDNEWIGPWGRVAIGIVAGVALLGWGELEQAKNRRIFGQGLTGGGVAVLYAAFYAAHGFYGLIGQTTAFALMILVTVTSGVAAIRYSSLSIALLGLVGGLLTPVMLGSGVDRQIALFSYVALLDLAALFVTVWQGGAKRAWRTLAGVAMLGTFGLLLAWSAQFYADEKLLRSLLVAFLFLLVFLGYPLALALRGNGGGPVCGRLDHLTTIGATLFFAGYCWALIHGFRDDGASPFRAWNGAVPLLFATLLTGWAATAGRLVPGEGAFRAVLVALACLFVVAVPPAQFDGGWVAIGWAVLVALAFSVSAVRPMLWVTASACLLWVVALAWAIATDGARDALFTSPNTLAFLALALATVPGLRLRIGPKSPFLLLLAGNFALLLGLSLEVASWADRTLPTQAGTHLDAAMTSLSILWTLHGVVAIAWGFVRKSPALRWIGLVLLAVTAGKVFLFDMSALPAIHRIVTFLAFGLLLVVASYFYARSRHAASVEPPAESR